MGTIAQKLANVATAKSNIATAITNKGGTVPTKFVDYGDAISALPSGGSDTLLKLVSRQTSPTWTMSASELSGLTTVGRGAFSHTPGMVGIELPSTVTTIDQYAFEDTGLTSITIPDSVTSFGQFTFRNSSNLSIIDFGGTRSTIPTFGSNMFYGMGSYKVLVPSSLLADWKATTGWSGSSISSHIYPHLDFFKWETYVVNASGEIIVSQWVQGPLTNGIMEAWLNQGVSFDGTETVVVGLACTTITADVGDHIGPSFFKLAFLDRTQSDIQGWMNYPWGFSTIKYLNSQTDHTV